jgi:dienelactone hydrolase
MHRQIRGSAVGALTVASLLLAGCGGGGRSPVLPKDPFAYNTSAPLEVQVTQSALRGPVEVYNLTYASAGGTRVPALFAIPRQTKPAGCLIYQAGLAPKQSAAAAWSGAARLGLAVFTIDPRYVGARASVATPLDQMLSSPQGLISFLRTDVVDLRRALDYLEGQPSCDNRVGYLGIGGGADLGVLLAGEDKRVRAAVLGSIGATWRSEMFYGPAFLQALAGGPGQIKGAVAQLAPLNPAVWIAKMSPRPVMIVDGMADPLIPPVDALNLAAAARDPKVFLLHPGGDSPFAGPTGQAVAQRVLGFLRHNLVHDRTAS